MSWNGHAHGNDTKLLLEKSSKHCDASKTQRNHCDSVPSAAKPLENACSGAHLGRPSAAKPLENVRSGAHLGRPSAAKPLENVCFGAHQLLFLTYHSGRYPKLMSHTFLGNTNEVTPGSVLTLFSRRCSQDAIHCSQDRQVFGTRSIGFRGPYCLSISSLMLCQAALVHSLVSAPHFWPPAWHPSFPL